MAAASLTVFVDGREIRVFGGNRRPVINEFELYKKMTKAHNPYGDGKASQRIVNSLT
jgi:UDP-N-acetylglucosamine 2-epimerase (non-hydrolysing)